MELISTMTFLVQAWSWSCLCAFDADVIQLSPHAYSESKIRHLILSHKPLHVRNAQFSPGCLESSDLSFFPTHVSGDFLLSPLHFHSVINLYMIKGFPTAVTYYMTY